MNITKKDLSVSIKEEFNLSGEQGSIIVDEFFASSRDFWSVLLNGKNIWFWNL